MYEHQSAGISHNWDVTPKEAVAIQNELRPLVIRDDQFDVLQNVAGIDVGFEENRNVARAAIVVLRYPELSVCATAIARRPVSFPYVPGLLSFREIPVVLEALKSLSLKPDLLFCDGHGFAHPRRFGLACHLGLATGLPSIGVAKSRLIGAYNLPAGQRGNWEPLMDEDEVIGAALCSRAGAKPIFVSIGHRVCLQTAVEITMKCTTKYRIPQPTRLAHQLASFGRITDPSPGERIR